MGLGNQGKQKSILLLQDSRSDSPSERVAGEEAAFKWHRLNRTVSTSSTGGKREDCSTGEAFK